ncbi:MAG: PQQ-binding-like beta-propeller repeat protein, partial [Planctomycetota bacterium]
RDKDAFRRSVSVVSQDDRLFPGTRWIVRVGNPLLPVVAIAPSDEGVLVLNETNYHIYDHGDGTIVGRYSIGDRRASTDIVVDGNTMIFGTTTGRILALSIKDGFKLWAYDIAGRITSDPARVDDSVTFVSNQGEVVTLTLDAGQSAGRREKIFGGTSHAPAVSDGIVFVPSLDQSIWAFSAAAEGGTVWRKRTSFPITTNATTYDGILYITLQDSGFTAFDTITGEQLWNAPSLSGEPVAARSGQLLVWSPDRKTLTFFNPETGVLLREVEMPTVKEIHAEHFEDDRVLLIHDDGSLDMFAPRR